MKTIFEFSDNVLGILIKKEIDVQMIEEIEKMLKERMQKYSDVRVYVEDQEKNGISVKAVLKHLMFHFSDTASLRKLAVVTDASFFKAVMEIKGKLIGTDVETFDPEDRLKAMNWIME